MEIPSLEDIATVSAAMAAASTVIWKLVKDNAAKLVKSEVAEMESRVMKALEDWKKEKREEDENRESRAKEDREAYRKAFEILTGRIDRLMQKNGST